MLAMTPVVMAASTTSPLTCRYGEIPCKAALIFPGTGARVFALALPNPSPVLRR
jgi:hypothetical protein